jgi:hypothetical protein
LALEFKRQGDLGRATEFAALAVARQKEFRAAKDLLEELRKLESERANEEGA